MLRIEARPQPVDAAGWRGSYASPAHARRRVAESCAVYLPGGTHPVLVYVELEERLPQVVAALRSIRFATNGRTSGMRTTSRTFGYAPRKEVRMEETCRRALLASEAPEAHATIAALSTLVEEQYRRAHAELYAQHVQTVAQVLPDWRLHGGVFTSGIINRDNRLPYHYDGGNFPESWSNMLVFRRHCQGGELVCPELDLSFAVADHSLLMFDGQAILHGVAPFRHTRPDGYRYSVVFYSLQQMWRCDPAVEGVRLAALRRTERERRRFQPVSA